MAWKGLGASVQPTQGAPRGRSGGRKTPTSFPSLWLPAGILRAKASGKPEAGWAALGCPQGSAQG